MLRPIFRSSMMLAALVVAYQAYVLLAVPLMEPPLAVKESQRASREEYDAAAQSITKYQLLLSNYFPKDHWSQLRPPKVIASSNEQAMLVLDDYERGEDGRVDIDQFTLLIFPTPPREGITPPRDAIILEAEKGARLQFDDFRPERGQIGQITRGQFPGRITIRSDMNEPGPEDDLLVETSDLEMNTKLLYTNNPVRFRMGQNIGGGRELEIRFLTDEHAKPNEPGLKLTGIDALEIRREVKMRLQLETDSLLPGEERDGSKRASPYEPSPNPSLRGKKNDAKPKPPVEVTCSGPFTFDFVRYVASLDRDVDLRQLNPEGPSDHLVCKQLDIHFKPRTVPEDERKARAIDTGKRQQRELGRLEPAAIVAEGHPVIVNSPSRSAQARGDRIHIVLAEQRVRVEGRSATFTYGANVLKAPAIEYVHPARESATTIGRFRASGPGSLHYVLDPQKPEHFFQAVWQTAVELGRETGQPVLTLEGRPQLGVAGAGSLTADRIKLYLRELEGDAAVGVPISGSSGKESKLQVAPDRMAALGRVEIHSPQLTGRTTELLATFRAQPVAEEDESADSGASGRAGPFSMMSPAGDAQQSFQVEAARMALQINMRGQTAQPATLECDGGVAIREVPLPGSTDQPLEIRGEQLIVDRLDSKLPFITLRGSSDDDSASGGGAGRAHGARQLAQLAGRGVSVLADVVEFDAAENRLWSDGSGKATLLVTRDLEGQATATPIPLDITWQGGLHFDGSTIVIERNVTVAGTDDTLRCDRLAARLTAPIQFGETIDQQNVGLAEVTCDGRVTIDHVSRDPIGLTSHERMQIGQLTINQNTGNITGQGPGVIRSTRYGSGLDALAGGQNPLGGATRQNAGSKLNFLRVDFHGSLSGNIHTRELTFHERVRTVYGPVDAWEQELEATRPETLPPDAMTLTCDSMRINEAAAAARLVATAAGGDSRPIGPVQLRAVGNVRIDGQVPGQGPFSAQAATASYDQNKETFVLEGDGRTPATLWRAGQTGSPPAVRKITYERSTGQFSVDGIQYFEFTPKDLERASRPVPVR